jgi:hypothetical protein
MKFLVIITSLFTAVSVVYATGLQIDTVHKPEDCPLKSRKGDQLSMQLAIPYASNNAAQLSHIVFS